MARSNAVGKLSQIVEEMAGDGSDAKEVILRQLGDLSGTHVLHNLVLVATHPGSKYHPGSTILRTDKNLQESQYQSSVGLVIKLGPGAFKDDDKVTFHGEKLSVGDWVLYRSADGLQLLIREVPCRLFDDTSIKMRVDSPELYW